MTSPLKNFDTSPFLHKNSWDDVLNVKGKKVELKTILKGLDPVEILEWAHLKMLRAFKFYHHRKFDKAFELLTEILTGIEEINENEEEMLKRLSLEIKVPCILKITSCLIERGKFPESIKICDYILGIDETNKEALHKKNVCLKLLNRKRNSELENIRKNQTTVEMNQEDTTISDCSSSDSNPNDDEKKKPRVLYYNNDMEELESFGYFKYFAYPIKKVISFTRNTLVCCKRSDASPGSDEERPEVEEDEESQEENF